MPEEGFDFSMPIVLAVLVIVWVLNIYIPVLLIRPMWGGVQMLVDIEPEAETPLPPPPPHVALPVITSVLALGAFGFGVHQMREQEHVGGRWLWVTAASAIAFFWALVLIVMTAGSWSSYLTQYAAA